MADYINKNILCQAYVHVEPAEVTDEVVERLREHLTDFVRTRAEFFLYPNPDIEIELKPGSIKLYATVLGTVSTLFAGVANYPNFRQGAISIYEDTKRLSEYITTESLYSTKARYGQVVRIEARTGVVGSIRKVVSEFNTLEGMNGTAYASRHAIKLSEIKSQVEKLIQNLNSDEDIALVKSGLIDIVNSLPDTPKPPPGKTNENEAILSYREERKNLKDFLI